MPCRWFPQSPFRGERRVIDISGDGSNNDGRSVTRARDEAVAADVNINGLPILAWEPYLDQYYKENVIGGPGAFMIVAKRLQHFCRCHPEEDDHRDRHERATGPDAHRQAMNPRAQFLREPLLHFLVIGAVLFAAYAWLNRGGDVAGLPQVRLADSDVGWLKETFVLQRQREPTPDELRGLVRELVKEELFARQAKELGLDKDDIVLRRRLAQKMSFLLQDNARGAEPGEDDLRRIYEAQRSQVQGNQGQGNQDQGNNVRNGQPETATLFTRPRISFTQIFFSRDRRPDAAADARAALQELSRAGAAAPAAELGDRIAGKTEFRNTDERAVANQLGAKFAARIFELAPGPWQGPIELSQGLHLVHITALTPAQLRPFDEVREQLVELWHEQSRRENEERYFVGLLKKYRLVPDESVKALVGPLLDEQSAAPKGAAP